MYATAKAVEQAGEVAPGRVVENVVYEAIRAGGVSREPEKDGTAIVRIDERVVAIVARTHSTLTGRKGWLITAVRRAA